MQVSGKAAQEWARENRIEDFRVEELFDPKANLEAGTWYLRRAVEQSPGLTWNAPELKVLDHLYSSLDPAEGLYWLCERSGAVERVVPEARIDWFTREPPGDTRAWTRARKLLSWSGLRRTKSSRPISGWSHARRTAWRG